MRGGRLTERSHRVLMQGVGDMRVHRLRGFERKNPDWGWEREFKGYPECVKVLEGQKKGAGKKENKGKRKKGRECSGLSFRTLQFF